MPYRPACAVQVLYDVVMLEVALKNGADPVTLANLMPKHWADFIRWAREREGQEGEEGRTGTQVIQVLQAMLAVWALEHPRG